MPNFVVTLFDLFGYMRDVGSSVTLGLCTDPRFARDNIHSYFFFFHCVCIGIERKKLNKKKVIIRKSSYGMSLIAVAHGSGCCYVSLILVQSATVVVCVSQTVMVFNLNIFSSLKKNTKEKCAWPCFNKITFMELNTSAGVFFFVSGSFSM